MVSAWGMRGVCVGVRGWCGTVWGWCRDGVGTVRGSVWGLRGDGVGSVWVGCEVWMAASDSLTPLRWQRHTHSSPPLPIPLRSWRQARGRTNLLPPRKGKVPPTYDTVEDSSGSNLLDLRIANVAQP